MSPLLASFISLFTQPIINELRSFVRAELEAFKEWARVEMIKAQQFTEAQEKGRELKQELLQAKTDAEIKAILRKTHTYIDNIVSK